MAVTKKFGRMRQVVALKAIIALISSILVLDLFVFANAGKDKKMGKKCFRSIICFLWK